MKLHLGRFRRARQYDEKQVGAVCALKVAAPPVTEFALQQSAEPAPRRPPSYHQQARWWNDTEWLAKYDRFILPDSFTGEHHHRILDRRYTLQQLTASIRHLHGSTAECGVFKGIGSALICATLQDTYNADERHYGFDSFAGLPAPGPNDADWQTGQLATPYEATRQHLAEFTKCELRVGWIPETFRGLEEKRFRLVHIDVDLEVPTRQCIEFFYPRAVGGAVFILDDHGFTNCPGARRAVEQFMADKPEPVIDLPTAQAFFYRT
jgi:hypothetical protein